MHSAVVLKVTPDGQTFGMLVQNRGSASQTFVVSNNGQQATGALSVVLGGAGRAEFR